MSRLMRAPSVIVAVALALAGAGAVVAGRLNARSSFDGLLATPTVSYGAPDKPAAADLTTALKRVGPDIVDSNVQWSLLSQHDAGSLSSAKLDATIGALRANTHVDARHARYVTLTDTSPVLPIGPVTTLAPLQRQPVWLVPIHIVHDTLAPGEREYLVLDARSGVLLERLAIVPVDPFGACPSVTPSLFHIGQLLCMFRHAVDPRAEAHRSVP